MKNNSNHNKSIYFYIPVAGIFLIIVSRALLSDGMFMDGLMYANISKNLANGLGTFWQPHMTETLFPVFINHPPLAFGLESIFFRILGDSRFIERLYSLLAIIITGLIIVSIWKSIGKKSSTGWLPLFLWIVLPSVTWASVNNMLENTMGVFICLSVLFYIKSRKRNRFLYLLLSGLMLSLGFLTKGFVTFFPISFPFFFWLFSRKTRFWYMFFDTIIIITASVLALVLLVLLVPEAREVIPKYISITFDLTVNSATKISRFYIVNRLLMELLPAIGILLAFLFFCWKRKLPLTQLNDNLQLALSFFFLGLSGVLPIMITKVQSGYYLLTSLPFFAISLALLVSPFIESLLEGIDCNSSGYKIFKSSGIALLISGILLSVIFSGHINRDRNKIEDMRVISAELTENSTISILPVMYYEWNLHAYYGRYKNISLDPDVNNKHEYLLIKNSLYSDTIKNNYVKIELKTNEYELFKRCEADASSLTK